MTGRHRLSTTDRRDSTAYRSTARPPERTRTRPRAPRTPAHPPAPERARIFRNATRARTRDQHTCDPYDTLAKTCAKTVFRMAKVACIAVPCPVTPDER